MGQSIVVNEKPSSNPGVTRFETNRAITGMGHERYLAGTEVWGERPPDELARRLLARGGVLGVQINSNVVTVDLEEGHDATGLKSIIENLYRFYPDEPAAAGDNTVVGAPSSEAADAPEQAAVPADGTDAVADDVPAPSHPTGVDDAAETSPTDEAGPERDEVPAEPEPEPEIAAESAAEAVDPDPDPDPDPEPEPAAEATDPEPDPAEVAEGSGPETAPPETEPA